MSIPWELLAGGAAVAVIGFGIWLALLNAKKRGAAEASAAASEEARKLENEMRELAGRRLTADEVIERIGNHQFGGPKP